MEKFKSLPKEKQKTILDAAFAAFGTNGYKKASMNDIASAAGISKAMMFHYFSNKKSLYIYLINVSSGVLLEEINEKFERDTTDFFDRILLATSIKAATMKKHPAILNFLSSLYFETDDEVASEVKAVLSKGESVRASLAFDGMDESKFKDGIDPKLVLKLLVCFADGYLRKIPPKMDFDLDGLLKEFYDCLNLMKNNFYKEEYL